MKNRVYFKSALRQPARILLLVLLIGLMSFAFTARAAQYALIQRETGRLGGYYRSIGTIANADPEDYDVTAGANLIAKSPYVEFEDRRGSCPAVLQGLYNGDIGGYTSDGYRDTSLGLHISDVFVYGELMSAPIKIDMSLKSGWEGIDAVYFFTLRVDQVEAGYPEYAAAGKTLKLYFIADETLDSGVLEELEAGRRYFLKAFYDPMAFSTLTPGENLIVKPLNDSGLCFLPVEPGEHVDFESPELAGLSEELAILQENLRAMFVTGTKDMSALPRAQQSAMLSYYLADGRWLNRDDDLNARNVCVVHSEFADFRGLSVGDEITLTFRDFKPFFSGYMLGGEGWENWREFPTHTESFEIVGLYGITSMNVQPSHRNTFMFIPDSRMPAGFGSYSESEVTDYSFVLKSSRDQEAFIQENRQALSEMGYTLSFVENNAENFWASATPILQSASMSAAVFAAVLVMGLILTAFLYLRLRRRDFAALRAMGLPARKAARDLLGPMAVVGLAGVAAGCVPSWRYAMAKAGQTLSAIPGPEGVEAAAELSPAFPAAIGAVIFALLLIFIRAGAAYLSRRPVLELLQGASGARVKKARAVSKKPQLSDAQRPETAKKTHEPDKASGLRPPQPYAAPRAAKGPGLSVSARFVLRQILRGPLKVILVMALALGFVLALGWMDLAIERSQREADRLYATTVVEAQIVKSNPSVFISGTAGSVINKSTVDAMLESGFVREAYLEACAQYAFIAPRIEFEGDDMTDDRPLDELYDSARMLDNVTFCAFDRPEAFSERHDIEIDYAPGWDAGLFTKAWTLDMVKGASVPVIAPDNTLELLGLEPGDGIMGAYIVTQGGSEYIMYVQYVIAGRYTGSVITQGPGEPMLMGLPAYSAAFEGFKERGLKEDIRYSTAEFTLDPNKNRELAGFREEMKALVGNTGAGLQDLNLVFWDEELTRVVGPLEQNIRLLSVLYPVTAALSVLIAAGVSVLLLLQSAKEAAALRAMGCTKARVGAMLSFQQALPCLFGVLIGFAGMAVFRGGIEGVLSGNTLLCAGLYLAGAALGAAFTSAALVRLKPMELLQVKE